MGRNGLKNQRRDSTTHAAPQHANGPSRPTYSVFDTRLSMVQDRLGTGFPEREKAGNALIHGQERFRVRLVATGREEGR
jgi:hypothetical protein